MGTKNTDEVIIVKRSRASVRRFIKDFIAIRDTPYWYHQTLTFKDAKTDEKDAKGYLNKLLDSLRKAFPEMPALFLQEWQKRKGLHYHVIFMLFGEQPVSPEAKRKELEKEIFPRWKAITGGHAVRDANWLTKPPKGIYGLWYLLKGVVPTNDKITRQPHWHGVRQVEIIKANSKQVSKQEARTAWNFVFSGRKTVNPDSATATAEKIFTMPDIEGMKAYLEWTGSAIDWEVFKRHETGRKGKVSDADLKLFYRQRCQPERKRRDATKTEALESETL